MTTGQPQPSKPMLSSSSRSIISAEPAASRKRRSPSARTAQRLRALHVVFSTTPHRPGSETCLDEMTGHFFTTCIFGLERAELLAAQIPAT